MKNKMSLRREAAERMKKLVGMATRCTPDYDLGGAKVLSQYVESGKPIRGDTRAKLERIAHHSSSQEAREVATNALNGISYHHVTEEEQEIHERCGWDD